MNTRSTEPTLNDLLADENFADELYRDPRGMMGRVLQAQERHLEARFNAHHQQQDMAAAQSANWDRFWKANPHISRADRNEVRRHLTEQFNGADKELTEYAGDPEGAFELMTDRADKHLAELAKQRAEDAEQSAVIGGPGREDEVPLDADRPMYSLTSFVKDRRSAKRSRGRGA